MNTGFYISGAGHALFIAFLLFGGLFARDRLPAVTVSDVTLLSEEEFAALMPSGPTPSVVTDAPSVAQPEDQPAATEVPQTEAAPERAEPPVAEPPQTPETVPEQPAPLPTPPAEVTDTAPQIQPPGVTDTPAAVTPDAAPAPAPRVAPEAAPPPPPEAETAPEVQQEVSPDAAADIVAEEAEATAPEEAATEIVTEAEEERETAPTASARPRARPAPPVQTAAVAPETPQTEAPRAETAQPEQPDDAATEAAIAAAVSEAAASQTPTASGPPLTGSERDAFRISVQRCWVVDVGSEAASVTVTVAVSLNPDGTIRDGTLRQLDASGGSAQAIDTAFQAARRAVLRCGASGFDLPVDKYDQWRDIEMTFNPEGMRLR